jgi:glycosyltransferase involved in cell wall biosynthesis
VRIVVASDHLPPHRSGHAVAAAWWIRALAGAGHHLTVVADAPPLPGLDVDWRRLPVLPGFVPGHPLAALRPIGPALADLADLRPDVLHLHGYGPACRHAARALPGVPVVVTVHALPEGSGAPLAALATPVLRGLLRALLRTASGVTVPSRVARARLAATVAPTPEDRTFVVPVGVDPVFAVHRRTGARPSGRPTFVHVGRRSAAKGFGLFERLARRYPNADWHAVGDGPAGPDAPFRVTPQADPATVAAALADADALLAPGLHETQGLVVLEALHCGTAVAAPRGSAQAEALTDGVHGALYEPTDDAAAWAALQRAAERTRAGDVGPPVGFERDALVDRMVGALLTALENDEPGHAER